MNVRQPRWGIRFPRPAAESGGLPLLDAPVSARLTVALQQNIGTAPVTLVQPGDRVLKGQPIARAHGDGPSAWVHAPSSGTVTELAVLPVTASKPGLCAVLETDGLDAAWSGYPWYPSLQPLDASAATLRAALTQAGIVGLGGAMFPTDVKLANSAAVDTLIINGVECEPHISCDDALMQTAADEILLGARIIMRLLDASCGLIAIKENSAALRTMQAALADEPNLEIRAVPAVYPAGDESQLFRLLQGKELPAGKLPADIGIVCQNVATVAAIARFFVGGEPLIERIVTVGGDGVHAPVNVRARIGTPISELVKCAGGYTGKARRLIMGGPMMGIALPDDTLPVIKACNSIYVAGGDELPARRPTMPCIRCGECAQVCPVQLTPQILLQTAVANDYEQLTRLGLEECMECGACDFVCPSAIPLTAEFQLAKSTLRTINFEQQRAEQAEQRYAAHQARKDKAEDRREHELEQQTESLGDARSALEELLKRTGANDDQQKPQDRQK